MQTGPAAGTHPCMGAPESSCSGGEAEGCFASVGTEQTKGLGVLCLEQERLGSSKPEVRLGLKEGQGKISKSQQHK